jgi:histone deacetylase complex regulatory component SIN3
MSSKEFCDLVQRRFKNHPTIYRKFGDFLKRISACDDPLDRLEMVKQLITLFDGHPDLVLNINQFLPDEYCIEIQHDAVVIKVFEQFGQATLVDTGHGRNVDNDPHRPLPAMATSVPSIGYIMNVKKAYADNPDVYSAFMGVLKHFHCKKSDELSTVNKVVALFRTRPDLVLGFNEFLPPGFSIHMYEKSGYVVEYPNETDGTKSRVKISVDAKMQEKKKKKA